MLSAILTTALLIFLMLFIFYKFIFLRDPRRAIPEGNNIVSPADGKIISIIKFNNNNLSINKGKFGKIKVLTDQKKGYLISIMMTIFDVHTQRAPIEGKVTNIVYKKGKFNNAVIGAKNLGWINNESNIISIGNKIKVIQVAGLIARRINCFVKINQNLKKGQRIGNIVLGSMVCLVLPETAELKVNVGKKVKAGETIISEIK